MYTNDMRRAFHSILPPKGFKVQVIDNEHFLTNKEGFRNEWSNCVSD
jgi:hypothetical protein